MLPNQRREDIYKLIKEDGQASVQSLSKLFDVTEVTIRQDLTILENRGLIKREYGGAYLQNIDTFAKNLSLSNQRNMKAKQAIAKETAKHVRKGDVIILDSGSTVTELAKLLVDMSNLTVITNSLNIALILGVNPNINLMVTGGEFKAPTLSLTGQKAADFFEKIHVDKLLLATAGISVKNGLTYPGISDIYVKQAMINSANVTYLLADSSKLGQNSFISLGDISLIDILITDSDVSQEDEDNLLKNNVNVIKAPI